MITYYKTKSEYSYLIKLLVEVIKLKGHIHIFTTNKQHLELLPLSILSKITIISDWTPGTYTNFKSLQRKSLPTLVLVLNVKNDMFRSAISESLLLGLPVVGLIPRNYSYPYIPYQIISPNYPILSKHIIAILYTV
jgi:ribosomal protein S2